MISPPLQIDFDSDYNISSTHHPAIKRQVTEHMMQREMFVLKRRNNELKRLTRGYGSRTNSMPCRRTDNT